MTGDVAQWLEYLPSMYQALGSIPNHPTHTHTCVHMCIHTHKAKSKTGITT